MDGTPSPLQIGRPNTRRTSEPSVPAALRAGSPVVGTSQDRATPVRSNTSDASSRLSQLFPSRPAVSASASVSAPSNPPASRRPSHAHPAPLVPAAEPAYRTPRAPPPPAFAEDTSYNPSANVFKNHRTAPTQATHIGTGVLSLLNPLRSGVSKGGNYNKLEDEDSGFSGSRLRGVEEVDEPLGYDLSGMVGTPMKSFEPRKKPMSVADAGQQELNLSEAGLVAEYERLESQLGAGMNSIIQQPFAHTPANSVEENGGTHATRSGMQLSDAQTAAEKSGGIVAVADIPIDISDFQGGAGFDTRNTLTAETGLARDEPQTSYFFPSDPDMPQWRPVTMGWPWIALLVVVALALAGLQEFLCQLSMRLVRRNPECGGLLKFKKPEELTLAEFFTWKYVPIMVFVFYGILWQMTDFEVKRLEPYYQLSQRSGATAGESLNMDYLTFMSWLVPLRALRHKQWAVIWSSVGTLVASSLVPVLQSASIVVHPKNANRQTGACKAVRVDPPWSRAVSGSLVVVALCGAALMYAMRRKSGLLSNPQGIAGIAAMATKSHILVDFHGLDSAPLEKIHKQLRHRRYILHKSSLWQGEYIRNSKERISERGSDPRPILLRKRVGVPFLGFMVAVTVLIPVLMYNENVAGITEHIPFLMTGLATVIRLLWNTMNCDVRMIQPFWTLARRHAPAKTLTLDYAGTNPLYLPIKAAMNRHILVTLVGIGAILAEILTVCVSSINADGTKFPKDKRGDDESDRDHWKVSYNTEQTFASFWSSFGLTMVILIYLIAIAVLVYVKRSRKFMPRQIGSIASVLAFIHQSKMLVNFVDTEMFDADKMTRWLEQSGKKYALGWFNGRDGDDHLGIDEEEVLSKYTYGVDWTQSRLRVGNIGQWEHF